MNSPEGTKATPSQRVLDRLSEKLDHWLGEVEKAKPFARSGYQTEVFQIAETLMGSMEGLRLLYERAHLFESKQVFQGGPWADASKLQPALVKGSLIGAGVYPVVETMSELRLLAVAAGRATDSALTRDEARDFLNEVMALNLEFVFPGDTEQERIEGGPHRDSNLRLFALIAEEIGLDSLRDEVVSEIEQVTAQHPVLTQRVRRMVRMAARIPGPDPNSDTSRRLATFSRAVEGPTELSRKYPQYVEYRTAVKEADRDTLAQEAHDFAESMYATGLVAAHHAILLRHLRAKEHELLPLALHLNDLGAAELAQNAETVDQLIQVAVLPGTAQSIYGLRGVLERGLLSRQEVTAGLTRLITLDLTTDVRRMLLRQRERKSGNTANSVLVAGTLSVLGSPLGVGQGRNPTCQAARGISLWAQHAPGFLIELIIAASRDGAIDLPFEGKTWRSDQLHSSKSLELDLDLDPVSVVLVPHLDRLYDQLMKLVALRGEDGHKWVNPALYGRWVPTGFASVFSNPAQTVVSGYEDFVRRFFATHHPAYNDGHALMYPNPVGLCVTNSHGEYLGPHAVSLQRIEPDPRGQLRAYFYNPNNEGRQNWGEDVRPSVSGHGENPGESSLPFDDFVARLYAFHYNPYEEGDAYAVPDLDLKRIEAAARNSWGRAFTWEPTL
jgi:hypothetical protein